MKGSALSSISGIQGPEHVVEAVRDDEFFLEEVLETLSERFILAQKALGLVADRYLGLLKHQLFEV
jgi:hypothetical protein